MLPFVNFWKLIIPSALSCIYKAFAFIMALKDKLAYVFQWPRKSFLKSWMHKIFSFNLNMLNHINEGGSWRALIYAQLDDFQLAVVGGRGSNGLQLDWFGSELKAAIGLRVVAVDLKHSASNIVHASQCLPSGGITNTLNTGPRKYYGQPPLHNGLQLYSKINLHK